MKKSWRVRVMFLLLVCLLGFTTELEAQVPALRLEILDSLPPFNDADGWVLIKVHNYDPAIHSQWDFRFWNLINVATDPGYFHWRWYEKENTKLGQRINSDGLIVVKTVHSIYDRKAFGFVTAAGPDLADITCGEANPPSQQECLGASPITDDDLPASAYLPGAVFDHQDRPDDGRVEGLSSLSVPWFTEEK